MWKLPINFLSLHYAWIVTLSILNLVIIYPYGNLKATDAYFFGASASTESGLNTIDIKELKTYQQVYIYIIPILGNLGFINIIVLVFRVRWFEKHLKAIAPHLLRPDPLPGQDSEALPEDIPELNTSGLEVTADRPSDQVMDNVAEANSHAETGKPSSRVSQESRNSTIDGDTQSPDQSPEQIAGRQSIRSTEPASSRGSWIQ